MTYQHLIPARRSLRWLVGALFCACSLWFLSLTLEHWSEVELGVLTRSPAHLFAALLLSVVFIALKGFVLSRLNNLFGFTSASAWEHIKLFCLSTFVEVSTFTGKVGADAAKYIYWGKAPASRRLSALVLFRLSAVFGILIPLGLLGFSRAEFLLGVLVVFLLTIVVLRRAMFPEMLFHSLCVQMLLITTLQVLTYVAFLLQFFVFLSLYDVAVTKDLAFAVLSSYISGVVSQVPFGLGVRDAVLVWQGEALVGVPRLLAASLLSRIFGEALTALCGWFVAVRTFLKKAGDE